MTVPRVSSAMNSARQQGYILLPVMLAMVLVAAIAFMMNREGATNINAVRSDLEATTAEYVAAAGMAHATWRTRHGACAGDMDMTTQTFGQAGAGTYTATVDAAATSTSQYTFTPDRDTFLAQGASSSNHASDTTLNVRRQAGGDMHALYHYDLSSIPGNRRVVSATAWFYVATPDPQSAITLHPVTADWTEAGATWDTHGGLFESATYGSMPPQPVNDVWVSVNVTALAQSWVKDPASNHGFLLRAITSDNVLSQYTSREYATASRRPYLEVTTADGAVSPVAITVTGTLTGRPSPWNDTTRTLTSDVVPAWQPPGTRVLQPGTEGTDTYLYEWKPGWNYGASNTIWVENRYANSIANGLLKFDLAGVPRGARVTSAILALYRTNSSLNGGPVGVHRVASAWVEGANDGANGAPNWTQRDSANNWSRAGGDYEATAFATTTVPGGTGWSTWEIAGIVNGWVSGGIENHGLALVAGSFGTAAHFASSDATDPQRRPKLTITYACECGSPCLAPQGSGRVGLVVVNPTTPVPSDAYKKALFESWGYTVNLIGENENAAGYMTASASNDVFFISETVNVSQLGNRIKDVPIGVVSQDGAYNSQLGFAMGSAWPVGSAINVTDTSHYITAPFPTGSLDIYSADMEQLSISGSAASGLQTLADTGGAGSLVVLDEGVEMGGQVAGEITAGRRVMLPLGREGKFNWNHLNGNGRLLVQRALQWGTGNTGATPARQLLFVSGGSIVAQFPSGTTFVVPTAQEQLRIDLIESWGYAVTLIHQSQSQADFDAAVAASDVAYVSSTVSNVALGTKLKSATIGVVNENMPLATTFGFATDYQTKSRDQIRVTDNAHYITSPLATGYIGIFTSLQTVYQRGATTADVHTLADSFNTGSDALNKPSLLTIETGGALHGGGSAAGRRVQLPWGDATFDVAALNADGKGIMQRAIEWAEGAGTPTGPVAHWMLDDGTGTTAIDSVGGHDGTLVNGPVWVAGQDGAALEFDGIDDYVDLTSDAELDDVFVGGATVMAWIDPASWGGNGYGRIFDKSSSPSSTGDGWAIRLNTDNGGLNFGQGFTGGRGWWRFAEGSISLGAWQHVAVAYDASSTANDPIVYLNGSPVAVTRVAAPSGDLRTDATINLRLGAHASGTTNGFDGKIDDARIYDRVLSASEIADIAGGGGGGSSPPAGIVVTQDTYLRGGSGNFGTEPALKVGRDNGGPVMYALVQFDISAIPPGTPVTSATLRLYQYAHNRSGSFGVGAHRIDETWTETGATWTTSDGSNAWSGGSGGSFSTPAVSTVTVTQGDYRWYDWDVTALVQEWVDNPPVSGNYGIQLIYTSVSSGNNVSFASREHTDSTLHPQLVVDY